MKHMIKRPPIPTVKKRTEGSLKASTGRVCLRPAAFAGPKSALGHPCSPYQAFNAYIHIFLHSAITIYKSILLLLGTRKKDAILASFGYKKSPSMMGFGSIKL